jgi:hypothetical protein
MDEIDDTALTITCSNASCMNIILPAESRYECPGCERKFCEFCSGRFFKCDICKSKFCQDCEDEVKRVIDDLEICDSQICFEKAMEGE